MKELYSTLKSELKNSFKKIKLVCLDFDGTLVENRVFHSQDGTESVIRSRADSLAIDLLKDAGLYNKENYKKIQEGIDIVIMSRETNPVVKSVADKIKIKCTQSIYEKIKAFEEEVKIRGLKYDEVVFIGNDLNDIECIKKAGIGVAVADSWPQVLKVADYVTKRNGGDGAFREVIELILYAKEKHPFQ